MNETLDCAVIGGGAAGLSAALVLGRARRRTLVVDAGQQSNRPSHGVGGLLGHDGRDPSELYEIGRTELDAYPSVEIVDGEAVKAKHLVESGGFEIELSDGSVRTARRLILATGMEYRVDDLPGLAELWGNSAFHCPFCHGWEARDGALAIRGNGDQGVHGALMLRGWSEDVTLLSDGPADLNDEQRGKLEAAAIRVDERPLTGLRAENGDLAAIRFADGTELERSGLMVAPRLHQRTDLAAQLGARHADPNPMAADRLVVDSFQRTTVPGVFAAGDVSGQFPQVAAAISSGSNAAAFVVQTLLSEDFGLPLPPALTQAAAN
ncbi:MAG: NAD(P)/FAD-dependent oxidoreductase [Solirubrobacterales bacterium]